VASRIQRALREPVVVDGKTFSMSMSIGIALSPPHRTDDLLRFADIAMYQAKDLGRNRHMLFDQDSDILRSTHRRIHWAKMLRDALDEDRIVLFSQPVVRLKDQRTMHHEILARMRDNDGRFIPPANFLEIAESLGLIKDIDLRVVEKLLAYMRENEQNGKRVRYFVNISRVSMSDPDWTRRFLALLRESGANPSQLVFEITETAAMAEIDVTLTFIRQLKDLGCRVALDDFGAGFSSFYYLKRFDVDYLKIDGSFIRDRLTEPFDRAMVEAIRRARHFLPSRALPP